MGARTDYITKGKLGDITFQMNPTEITWDDGSVWGEINSPGMKNPILTYSYGKASTINFSLYMNSKHARAVDIPNTLKTLQKYRKDKEPILFTYMGVTRKVVIVECPYQILSMNGKLVPTEVKIDITLKEIL